MSKNKCYICGEPDDADLMKTVVEDGIPALICQHCSGHNPDGKIITLACFGVEAVSVLIPAIGWQLRTPKKGFMFRERNFDECEGTDFWEITPEEHTKLIDQTELEEEFQTGKSHDNK